ncbi:hypothetical protein [Rothia nasimurium]|uniref:hypothetical protein n=1 Tax=Rothia nasimurium TaxID=85336 RepID=UPI001F3C51D9|nr:hypothetical protein [Rothia nasimurium]
MNITHTEDSHETFTNCHRNSSVRHAGSQRMFFQFCISPHAGTVTCICIKRNLSKLNVDYTS